MSADHDPLPIVKARRLLKGLRLFGLLATAGRRSVFGTASRERLPSFVSLGRRAGLRERVRSRFGRRRYSRLLLLDILDRATSFLRGGDRDRDRDSDRERERERFVEIEEIESMLEIDEIDGERLRPVSAALDLMMSFTDALSYVSLHNDIFGSRG